MRKKRDTQERDRETDSKGPQHRPNISTGSVKFEVLVVRENGQRHCRGHDLGLVGFLILLTGRLAGVRIKSPIDREMPTGEDIRNIFVLRKRTGRK